MFRAKREPRATNHEPGDKILEGQGLLFTAPAHKAETIDFFISIDQKTGSEDARKQVEQ